jgi:putative membrane protein
MPALTKLLLGAATLGLCALPYAQAQTILGSQDQSFIEDAAKAGMLEVHMGQLALERGMSPEVKAFSQRLINDHTKANEELGSLAAKKGVTLPPDDAQTAMSMPIATKNGADFDRQFAQMMISDHQKAIALFEKEASSGTDPELKAWATKTLPTLRAHLADAEALPK